MRVTIQLPQWDGVRDALGRRGRGIALALIVEALFILLLLGIAPKIGSKERAKPNVFGFQIDSGDTAEQPEQKTEAKAEARRSGGAKATPTRPVEPVPAPSPVPPPPPVQSDVIWLTRQQYAASEIRASQPQPPGSETASTDSDAGISSARDSRPLGRKGPHGETLYPAEWYREPTHAELSAYAIDKIGDGGWGEIACRTIDRYHVTDCQEVADWPRGSGLAGAVRQSAFQFLVRPPRVGGKMLVGAWVLIRIDYQVIRGK